MFKLSKKIRALITVGFIFSAGIMSGCGSNNDSATISNTQEFLNVSYDPTRKLYSAYN